MTEYWVSQGNKWCEHCKIYIANNPISIRTHEAGQRHKDNVAKKLAALRKENVNKEKQRQQAEKDLERIESEAQKTYAKDLAEIKAYDASTTKSEAQQHADLYAGLKAIESPLDSSEWTHDQSTGYYYNASTGVYCDRDSGLYFSDKLGKWSTQEETLKAIALASTSSGKPSQNVAAGKSFFDKPVKLSGQKTQLSGPILSSSKTATVIAKGRPSSLQVKRKREEKKAPISSEEAKALAAREAARKRTEEREKGLMGLYKSSYQ